MKIDGKVIAQSLLNSLKKEIKKVKRKISLAIFLVGESSQQQSFVRIKEKVAKKLGINFKFFYIKTVPSFEEFLNQINQIALDKNINGLVIQLPLPTRLNTFSLFDYLPATKEIEGFGEKSKFLPPIGQAVLTVLKHIYLHTADAKKLLINQKDEAALKKVLHQKKIVVIGRGKTGGQPIGKVLNHFKINFISINSKTIEPEKYLKQADIIISAVGKKVIFPSMLKPGVVLINVGLREENGKLKGDYEEKEIKKIASFYTPTPGGIGPIDIVYLYKNLIEAAKK
jgi:methylenetetrahydrofolate dehydrogenase (NADP+)/methenyltetrahydrofolate cyclohydrolase